MWTAYFLIGILVAWYYLRDDAVLGRDQWLGVFAVFTLMWLPLLAIKAIILLIELGTPPKDGEGDF